VNVCSDVHTITVQFRYSASSVLTRLDEGCSSSVCSEPWENLEGGQQSSNLHESLGGNPDSAGDIWHVKKSTTEEWHIWYNIYL
jgi:hypothetical protein